MRIKVCKKCRDKNKKENHMKKVLLLLVGVTAFFGMSVGLFSDAYDDCHNTCRGYDKLDLYNACMHGCCSRIGLEVLKPAS